MKPTTQNTSTAVMQRRIEPDESLDYFPTPPWATRALCQFLRDHCGAKAGHEAWEPACGEMHMADVLAEQFKSVRASDVIRYGPRHELIDFVDYAVWKSRDATDWIITNPPFQLAEPFIARARRLARRGVVMFVRSAFTEGGERYRTLFNGDQAPTYVVTYAERVVLLRNRLIQTGKRDPFNYDPQTYEPRCASTATAYSLVIWLPGQHDTRHRWIPPCRVELERATDYPAYADQWAELRALQAAHSEQAALL